jgi:hypothetical protein
MPTTSVEVSICLTLSVRRRHKSQENQRCSLWHVACLKVGNNPFGSGIMKLTALISSLSLAVAVALTTTGAQAAALVLDLSEGGVNSGVVNGATFSFNNGQPAGTGFINSFVRIQENGNEQGYNTSGGTPFDTKAGNFTRDLKLGELLADNGYFRFLLDINEQNNSNGRLLSLDGLKVFVTTQGGQTSQSVDGAGNANGILGTLLWNLDAFADNYILLDHKRAEGSGKFDMAFDISSSLFAGYSADTYVVLWSRFGLQEGSDADSDAGFEEWAARMGKNQVPEPGVLALIGLGLVAAAAARRRQA